jgi:hypothetical protein
MIALQDLDFYWSDADVKKVSKLYKESCGIRTISKTISRPVDEVAILIIDLGRKGEL